MSEGLVCLLFFFPFGYFSEYVSFVKYLPRGSTIMLCVLCSFNQLDIFLHQIQYFPIELFLQVSFLQECVKIKLEPSLRICNGSGTSIKVHMNLVLHKLFARPSMCSKGYLRCLVLDLLTATYHASLYYVGMDINAQFIAFYIYK